MTIKPKVKLDNCNAFDVWLLNHIICLWYEKAALKKGSLKDIFFTSAELYKKKLRRVTQQDFAELGLSARLRPNHHKYDMMAKVNATIQKLKDNGTLISRKTKPNARSNLYYFSAFLEKN